MTQKESNEYDTDRRPMNMTEKETNERDTDKRTVYMTEKETNQHFLQLCFFPVHA